jgi:hypothetical protein
LSDLPLRLSAAAFGIPDRPRLASLVVSLGVGHQPAAGTDQSAAPTFAVSFSAYTTEGDRKDVAAASTTVTLAPEAAAAGEYEVLTRLELPAGRVRLRVAAVEERSGRLGTVLADVDVPDYAGRRLSASDLVVGVERGSATVQGELRAPFLPVVPTMRRDFASTAQAQGDAQALPGRGTPAAARPTSDRGRGRASSADH